MTRVIEFKKVSTEGLEASPVAKALAGLRANEARYFMNKYKHVFTTEAASERPEIAAYIQTILLEREIIIASEALEVSQFILEGTKFSYVFYQNGLAINVMYGLEDGSKRAVGFKLSEGIEIPTELAAKFKFARQKSKLAGTIRGSYFVIKGKYE